MQVSGFLFLCVKMLRLSVVVVLLLAASTFAFRSNTRSSTVATSSLKMGQLYTGDFSSRSGSGLYGTTVRNYSLASSNLHIPSK